MKRIAWFTLVLAGMLPLSCQKKESVGQPAGAETAPVVVVPTPPPVEVVVPEAVIGTGVGLKEPRGIAVDARGQIFVCDTGNHRVVRLDPAGRLTASWGGETKESTPGKFGLVTDLTVSASGQIVVVDAKFGDVQVFTPDGRLTLRLPSLLPVPSGVAVAADGRLWVVSTNTNRVFRFTPEGKAEATFDGTGSRSHLPFEQPLDVALAPDGTAYVADLRGRIMRLAADGSIADEWKIDVGTNRGGSQLVVVQGLVVMSDPDRGRLDILDPATGSFRCIGTQGLEPGQFRLPIGVGRGPDDKLYVVDSGNGRIQVFGRLGPKEKPRSPK